MPIELFYAVLMTVFLPVCLMVGLVTYDKYKYQTDWKTAILKIMKI